MNLVTLACRSIRVAAAVMVCCLVSSAVLANGVSYEFVTVGNAGNASDETGYGAVAYEYQIGKYEVTMGQYAAFLNAVAASDLNGLWNSDMATIAQDAGISQSGSPGSYSYTAIGPSGVVQIPQATTSDRPISHVGWFNAARFANWMSNGKPSGAQGPTTTENGAYDLSNWASGIAPARNLINPNTGLAPTHLLPTENEWYKAAYYSPALNSGAGAYYTYATQSSATPGNVVGGGNDANYIVGGLFSVTQSSVNDPNQNYLVNVGSFGSSFYGTFDQSGNVREWNDLDGIPSLVRGLRGGGYENSSATNVSSSQRSTPAAANLIAGFRLAGPVAVPEPSTWVMGLSGLVCISYTLSRRKRA
ncbi:MAG: formylglycine-generating enzyme family protein [Planctomycetaceae bacterium]